MMQLNLQWYDTQASDHNSMYLHRVPKLATPLLQTRLIQFKVHGFQRNIAHCTTLALPTVEGKCTRWRSTMLMSCASVSRVQNAWEWWDELDQRNMSRRSSSGAPASKSLRRGQRWPLRAQTLKTIVQNDRLHECFTLCKNMSGINAFTPTYL